MSIRLSTAACVASLAATVGAQDFNIDVSDLSSSPTATYGAATGQVGVWNVLIGGPPYQFTMNDLAGIPTSVTTDVVAVGNGLGDFNFDNVNTIGDDEFLMDDCQDIGNGGTAPPSETTWTFSGLNPVNYDVTVYAWAPDNATFVSSVSDCGTGAAAMISGAWPGGFAEGVTHATLDICAGGGVATICVNSGGVDGNFSSVNGMQWTETGGSCEAGIALCFGDGTGGVCGCGNSAGSGEGCANSTGVGAVIVGSGAPSISGDTLVMTATQTTNQPGVFFQGNNAIASPPTFGDGIRCCGGGVVRIMTMNTNINCAATDLSCGTQIGGIGPPISQHPGNSGLLAGDSRCYQYWYRDPGAGNPCGANFFNLSNGYVVDWTP